MTFDCGVTREMGEDPVAVCRYLGERDCINHVHFRNVVVRKPYVDYTEVFLDEGQVDMFAVMKELVRQKYPRTIYPEHPRAIDLDREQRRDPEPVSGRRRVRGRDLQRRLRAGDAPGGADAVARLAQSLFHVAAVRPRYFPVIVMVRFMVRPRLSGPSSSCSCRRRRRRATPR